MFSVKNLIMASLCVALGVVLPIAFHSVPNAASVLLPMHLPVLLCGIVVGPVWGLVCGIVTPSLSFLLTGMPPAPMLLSITCELAVYGSLTGLFMRLFPNKQGVSTVYASLIAAMVCGRVVAGVLNALIFKAGDYSYKIWVTAMFVTAFPGILIQLILIPVIVMALRRAGVVNYGRIPG